MWEDPIVKETRAAREKLVEEFGGDLDALWEYLQETQKKYQGRVVTGEPKPPITADRKAS
jgi:hypothetical protein